jgi:glycosyltransferase involved in cell wall biosynthesis
VKHLARLGWKPHVLTGPGDARRLQDPSLLGVVPEDVPVTRTGMIDTGRVFRLLGRLRLARVARMLSPTLPNMEAGWILPAYRAGLRTLERGDFSLIFSSAYPMSSHVTAYLLKKKTGLPWVADYRDEWSTRSILRWPTPLHRWLARRLDQKLITAADTVVTTSPAAVQVLSRAFPLASSKYVTITNGFDLDDFKMNRRVSPLPALSGGHGRNGKLHIAHVGSTFPWQKPQLFLTAVERLIEDGALKAGELRIHFVGNSGELSSERLEADGIFRRTPYVDHATAINVMAACDLLLVINGESVSIPGKIYEYLAADRPILAILPPGPAADIIMTTGAGTVVPPEVEEIAAALRRLVESWREGKLSYDADPTVVAQYSRRETTRQLAEAFESVMKDHAAVKEKGNGRP